MKTIFIISLLLFTSICNAQDTTLTQATATAAKVQSKADSFMVIAAGKLGVDTNMSAAQLGQQLDQVETLIPGKHATFLKWLKFLSVLFTFLVGGYFFIKHGIIKGFKAVTGASVVLLLLTLNSCKTGQVTTNFSANSATVKEQIGTTGAYIEETAVIHVAPNMFDTAGVLIIAPDNITNALLMTVKNDVCKVVPNAPICK